MCCVDGKQSACRKRPCHRGSSGGNSGGASRGCARLARNPPVAGALSAGAATAAAARASASSARGAGRAMPARFMWGRKFGGGGIESAGKECGGMAKGGGNSAALRRESRVATGGPRVLRKARLQARCVKIVTPIAYYV